MSNPYQEFDEYGLRHVPAHFIESELWEGYEQFLTHFQFLQIKISRFGPQALLEDYELGLVPNNPLPSERVQALKLIQGAIRLSAHILTNDPSQLASQLHGRLCSQTASGIKTLLAQTRGKALWLRPMTPTFVQSGEALLRTLIGHREMVTAVAVTPNGRQVVSASIDNTLKVWDIISGTEQRILVGHTDRINAVAVMPDGRQVVSASSDKTLKIWNLDNGKEQQTLVGHTNSIWAVTVTPEGKQIVSASGDGTLKV